jgi:hypothetical protein
MPNDNETLRNIEAITVDMKELIERELIPLAQKLSDKSILAEIRMAQAALTTAQGLAVKQRNGNGS